MQIGDIIKVTAHGTYKGTYGHIVGVPSGMDTTNTYSVSLIGPYTEYVEFAPEDIDGSINFTDFVFHFSHKISSQANR